MHVIIPTWIAQTHVHVQRMQYTVKAYRYIDIQRSSDISFVFVVRKSRCVHATPTRIATYKNGAIACVASKRRSRSRDCVTVHWSAVAIPQEAGGMASLIVNMQTIGAVGAAGQAVQDVSYDGDELQRVQL